MERNSPSETEARAADHNISRHKATRKLVKSFRVSLSLKRQFNSVTFLNTLVFQVYLNVILISMSMSLKWCVPLKCSN
jgi:hypothetical protein